MFVTHRHINNVDDCRKSDLCACTMRTKFPKSVSESVEDVPELASFGRQIPQCRTRRRPKRTTATLYASVNHAKWLSEIRPAGKTVEGVVSLFATLIPTDCITPFLSSLFFRIHFLSNASKANSTGR